MAIAYNNYNGRTGNEWNTFNGAPIKSEIPTFNGSPLERVVATYDRGCY